MEIHELKTIPPYFEQVADGTKTFEVRKDDRNFQVGDWLKLREYRPELACGRGDFTGNHVLRVIEYILPGGQFGIEDGHVVMSLGYI